MLSELIPPAAAAPEPPTPVLDAGEPVTPLPPEAAVPGSVAPELGTDVAMASIPEPLGDPSGSSALVPEALGFVPVLEMVSQAGNANVCA